MSPNWQLKYSFLLILLIIVPSFFLAYFSFRYAEAERVAFRQRISESYRGLAQFAALQIDNIIDEIGDQWIDFIHPKKFAGDAPEKQTRVLEELIQSNNLINNAYLVTNTGTVSYPIKLEKQSPELKGDLAAVSAPESEEWLLKFRNLSEEAERLEFKEENPPAALEIYHRITKTFPVTRLQAIAYSEIARIYMFRAEWQIACDYYQKIIREYPRERDLNNLHLRFYAQFQCVVALENLGKLDAAMAALLTLYQDLLDHSDEVNRVQYEFFLERIQRSFKQLIGGFSESDQAGYTATFKALQEQKKKSIGTNYLVEKLHQRLSKRILKRETFKKRFRYFSDFAAEQPYLVAYILLSESDEFIVKSVLGLEINLEALKAQIFPQIVNQKNFPRDVTIAILDQQDKFIMGDEGKIISEPALLFALNDPLEFWQLGFFPTLKNPLLNESNADLYIKLLGVFFLFLVIVVGTGIITMNIRKQQRLSQQKTTFISSISHELKTPLTSIKMFVDFLSKNEKLKEDEETEKYLKIIRSESERLNRLVDNVLDYSRIERGVKKYQFEYEESEAVIRSVVDAFNYHAETHGIKIDLALAKSLPEIYMDRHAISQAIINLLANAIKYSVDKKPVKVAARQNGKFLNIEVCDQGIGIKQKHIKQVFNDYYRVEENEAANIAGTGLGLPLVKHIAEAHGGSVSVESIYGKGSTFTLKLPLSET